MLYTGAVCRNLVEDARHDERWIAPRHMIWMGDTQAADGTDAARTAYARKPVPRPDRWYAENSREFRDTVLTKGLLHVGAAVERPGLPVNSSKPRYALTPDFAGLFDPGLEKAAFVAAAAAWRGEHLTNAALVRMELVRATLAQAQGNIEVRFPGGGGIVMPGGASPPIVKAVVEEFAPRFLAVPRVVWISDSQDKDAHGQALLRERLGIKINAAKLLPDLILVDLNPPGRPGRLLVVFVEIVASEGPVDDQRRAELSGLLTDAGTGLTGADAAFVTAYLDKTDPAYRRTAHSLAWPSFAWFVSEPGRIVQMHDERTAGTLAELLDGPGR